MLRNNDGRWLHGYCRLLGQATNTVAEIMAIREGFQIVKGFRNLVVEYDSQAVLSMFGSQSLGHHPLATLIDDRLFLSRQLDHVCFNMFLRRVNVLDNLGVSYPRGTFHFICPPAKVLDLLRGDMVETIYLRFNLF